MQSSILFAIIAFAAIGCSQGYHLHEPNHAKGAGQPGSCEPASHNCDDTCQLPDCACAGSEPNITLAERPQIVYLTFDDAFTALAEQNYYRGLFDGSMLNPNGCPIRATHFLSARSNDYSMVHKYWAMGHEMASHGITHRSPPAYWKNLTTEGWKDEIGGMKEMINLYAKVPRNEIRGVRAPFLQGGGDTQFEMMKQEHFEYDCSMPTQSHGFTNMENGWWPYTLDFNAQQDCQIEPCPQCSHEGIWSQPMLDLEDNNILTGDHGFPCAMLDSCQSTEQTSDTVFDMLTKNFERAYNGKTRAPFGLYVHAAWFFGYEWRYEGYKRFLESILENDDVWIVPIHSGINYRRNPATNDELIDGTALKEFFGCENFPQEDCSVQRCKYSHVVNEDLDNTEEYITTCDYCPDQYPWLGNPSGN